MTYSGELQRPFLRGRCIHEGTPVTIRHWQLRDLVSFADSPDQVLAVRGSSVVCYPSPPAHTSPNQHNQAFHDGPAGSGQSLQQQQQPYAAVAAAVDAAGAIVHAAAAFGAGSSGHATVVMEMGFQASCMAYCAGFLAAGGQAGELAVRDLRQGAESVGSLYRGPPEGSVNNALHIAPAPLAGGGTLFVCNNDSTIKVYRLPDMYRLTTIQTPVPSNYTALSPDRSLLLSVGDCTNGTIYQARESCYEQYLTFDEASDCGMGCSWSPSGSCLAAAFQDGTVLVWDHRAGKTIHKWHLQSASRCVKFSPAPLDLLAFTENEDYAHVVDMRRWDLMQHLSVVSADDHPSPTSPSAAAVTTAAAAPVASAGAARAAGQELLASLSSIAAASGNAGGQAGGGAALVPFRPLRAPSLASLIRQRQHSMQGMQAGSGSGGGGGLGWSRELVHAETGSMGVRLVGTGLTTVGAVATRRPSTTIRMYHTNDPDGVRLLMEPQTRGVDIAGLCWSPDGSRVAVGSDQAVVTFEVDQAARRQFGYGSLE